MAPRTKIPKFPLDPKDITPDVVKKFNPKNLSRKKIEQQGGLNLEHLPDLEEYINWLGKSKLLEKLGINPGDVTFEKFLETQRWELRVAAAERDLSGNWNHIAHNRSVAAGGYPGLFNTSPGFARQNVIEGPKSGINPRLAEEGGFATDKFNAYLDFVLSGGNKPYPKLSDGPYEREQHFHRGQSIDALRASTELWRRRVLHPESPDYTGWSFFEQPWRVADTTQSHGGKVKVTQGDIRDRQGFAPGQAGRVVSPFITAAKIPELQPQQRIRLPETTSTQRPETPAKLNPQERLQIDPNLPQTPEEDLTRQVLTIGAQYGPKAAKLLWEAIKVPFTLTGLGGNR